MGQKVNPHGLRVGVIKDWNSKWYADKHDFADYLIEDNKVREYVKKKLYAAGVSKVLVERPQKNSIKVSVLTGKPGMVIGRDGSGIEDLKKALVKMTGKTVDIEILEIKHQEIDAQLQAESIAQALERRVAYRRAMKSAIQRTMKAGARGIKVTVGGRVGGAEIARSEKYAEGNVPLQTLRADIDYGFAEADTTYGKLGVKVWINHGEVLDKELQGYASIEKEEKKNDRKERKGNDRRKNGENRKFDKKSDKFQKEEQKAKVNPRVRKEAPKVEKKVEEVVAPVEEANEQ